MPGDIWQKERMFQGNKNMGTYWNIYYVTLFGQKKEKTYFYNFADGGIGPPIYILYSEWKNSEKILITYSTDLTCQ